MRFHSFTVRLFWSLGFVLLLVGVDAARRPAPVTAALARTDVAGAGVQAPDLTALRRVAQGNFELPPGARASHASSLVVMPPQSPVALTAFWFSGERESGPQVEIAAAQLDRATATWSAPVLVLNRHVAAAQLGFGIRRFGNPVGWIDGQGRMHLFVVATGGGGWAASRVLHLVQASATQQLPDLAFDAKRVLPLSWLWNTSFLVRNAPLPLADGGMVLPVHFELGFKVPAAVRFDQQGRMLGFTRLSRNNYWLQPALLALGPSHWMALMRDEREDGKIGAVESRNGGQTWRDLPDLAQPNPDAAVATLSLAPQRHLLAHNPVNRGRAQLELSQSTDGTHWSPLMTLEQGAPDAEFSYPAMAWVDGSLWVTYTVDRERMSWQRFSLQQGSP